MNFAHLEDRRKISRQSRDDYGFYTDSKRLLFTVYHMSVTLFI